MQSEISEKLAMKRFNFDIESSALLFVDSASVHLTFQTAQIELSAKVMLMTARMEITKKATATMCESSSRFAITAETTLKRDISSAVLEMTTTTCAGSTRTTRVSTSSYMTSKTERMAVVISKDCDISNAAKVMMLTPNCPVGTKKPPTTKRIRFVRAA